MINRSDIKGLTAHKPVRAEAALVFAFIIIFTLINQTPLHSQALTVEQWLDVGWDYYNAGRIDDAFKTFISALEIYPESAEVHLALGEIYVEMGQIERGRSEFLTSLRYDDQTPLAARAHYNYALSIREEDPWNALLHLNRAHELGGSRSLQFEIAHQIRFCNLIVQMPLRSQSGPIVLHYSDYLLSEDDGFKLAQNGEAVLFRAETFCNFDLTKPIHFFLYPSDRAVRAEVMMEEDDYDPEHREYHIPFAPDIDLLPALCVQVIADLQSSLNRHAGADWVNIAMPVAVSGQVEWGDGSVSRTGTKMLIDCDEAVRSLVSTGAFVDLQYLFAEELIGYSPELIIKTELGSFLRWVRRNYEIRIFHELITQPNVEIILNDNIASIQQRWLNDINNNASLLSDPNLGSRWAETVPLSPLAGDPELPTQILKEGLRLYLAGERISGLWEIRRAIEMDPGMGLGYYTLGWIACRESRWEEAEKQLGLAVLLFENPVEIAWCHALLSPIYLSSGRWGLALASLQLVVAYSDSEEIRNWAADIYPRIEHITMLSPMKLDPESVEYELMREFMVKWDDSANSRQGVSGLTSSLMNDIRAQSLSGFYSRLKNEYPSITFRHEVQSVGVSGNAVYLEVKIFADFQNRSVTLPLTLESLTKGGYLFYFQLIPSDDSWLILDWEDGNFPTSPVMALIPERKRN